VEAPPEVRTPERFDLPAHTTVDAPDLTYRWWEAVGDTTLTAMVESALGQNLSLQEMAYRVEQARSLERVVHANRFPWLTGSLSKSDSEYIGDGPEAPQVTTMPGLGMSATTTDHTVALSLSRGADLFAANRAARQAATADLLSTEEAMNQMALSLSAQVALSWYSLVALHLQAELLRQTVDSYASNLVFMQGRYERGVVTSNEVYRAQTTLHSTRSQLASALQAIDAAKHALAVLMGQYPTSLSLPETMVIPDQLLAIPDVLPSELLQRRPDIRSAYSDLVAADRRAAEAAANRYPQLSITASLSRSADSAADLTDLSEAIRNTTTNLTMPLFYGGQLRENARANEAAFHAQQYTYMQTVLNAFQEVEDNLSATQQQTQVLDHTQRAVIAAKMSQDRSYSAYLNGTSSYLEFNLSEATYLAAELDLIHARRDMISTQIALIVSLGGGWTEDATETLVTSFGPAAVEQEQ